MNQENTKRISENKASNVYFMDNANYFNELFDIVVNNPKHFGRMIFSKGAQCKHENREHLATWINQKLPMLSDSKYTITTKCYWILNGLVDFPQCAICGDPIFSNALNIDSYNKTCCKRDCLNELTRQTRKEKNIENGIVFKSEVTRARKEIIQNQIETELRLAKTHQQFVGVFMLIYKKVGRPFEQIQKNQKYKKLYDEIVSYTPLLDDPFFTFATRCYWFANNMTAFPICSNQSCHKEIKQNIRSFVDGYQRKITIDGKRVNEKDELYCCIECAQSSTFTIAKKSKTKIEHFNDPNYNNRPQAKQTTQQRFGADNVMKTEIGKQHLVESIQRHFGSQYTSSSQVPEVKVKYRQTIDARTVEERQRIGQLTKDYWNSLSEEEKHEITSQAKKTYRERTGYNHPSQDPNVKHGKVMYVYDGYKFASSWELILFLWLKIHKYSFVFQPTDSSFEYFDCKGKMHVYHPDFKILQDGKEFSAGIYEIKGDNHFDKKTGKLLNISDPTKNYIAEAKHKCMLDNGVKIITSVEINQISAEVLAAVGGKRGIDEMRFQRKEIRASTDLPSV